MAAAHFCLSASQADIGMLQGCIPLLDRNQYLQLPHTITMSQDNVWVLDWDFFVDRSLSNRIGPGVHFNLPKGVQEYSVGGWAYVFYLLVADIDILI